MGKSKQSITNSSKTKLNTIWTDRLVRLLINHQETLEDILPEKYLLEKPATMKRFEYSLLGKELKGPTDIAKKQYQELDDIFDFDNIIKKEELTL